MRCTGRAAELLRNHHRLQVHSTYNHTVNVLAEGHLLAFHQESVPATPLSLVLPFSVAEFVLLTQEAERTGLVWIDEDEGIRIRSGMFDRKARELEVWEDRIYGRLGEIDVNSFMTILTQVIHQNACCQGCADIALTQEQQEADNPVTAVLRGKVRILMQEGMADRLSESLFRDTIRSLIGLGVGLTPSGDDFLTGMLLACQVVPESRMQRAAMCGEVLHDVITGNLDRTNDISREYLTCAMDARFGENYHRLLRAGSDEDKVHILERILETGHTSGLDALNGLAAGLCILTGWNDR